MRGEVATRDVDEFRRSHYAGHGKQPAAKMQRDDNSHSLQDRQDGTECSDDINPVSAHDDRLIGRPRIRH